MLLTFAASFENRSLEPAWSRAPLAASLFRRHTQ
jgi:hypothetical protein